MATIHAGVRVAGWLATASADATEWSVVGGTPVTGTTAVDARWLELGRDRLEQALQSPDRRAGGGAADARSADEPVERRTTVDRRVTYDRRQLIRFEDDRRVGIDRRAGNDSLEIASG